MQYAGSVTLDDADAVYFLGIGFDVANPNPDGSQDPYLEKRKRSDLSLVARKMFGGDKSMAPGSGGASNKEPWGGLKFFPKAGASPGQSTVYSAGWTMGSYEGVAAKGGGDVWLAAFDENLNELWAEGWGSSERDWAWDLDVDTQGFIYVTGMTLGNMAGPGSNQGLSDGFVSRLDLNGNVLGSFQIGTREDERAMLTADANGVYVGGYTFGSLVKATQGFIDAFVLKLSRSLEN